MSQKANWPDPLLQGSDYVHSSSSSIGSIHESITIECNSTSNHCQKNFTKYWDLEYGWELKFKIKQKLVCRLLINLLNMKTRGFLVGRINRNTNSNLNPSWQKGSSTPSQNCYQINYTQLLRWAMFFKLNGLTVS